MNGVASQAYLESKPVKETRALISELCRQFYTLGWVSGTGGSITIKVHDDSIPKPQQLILMSPSGLTLSLFLVWVCLEVRIFCGFCFAFWVFIVCALFFGVYALLWFSASKGDCFVLKCVVYELSHYFRLGDKSYLVCFDFVRIVML